MSKLKVIVTSNFVAIALSKVVKDRSSKEPYFWPFEANNF